ncbi:class I SAM-dependent methyltransferase [Cohnella sp.]|uniref:class I SAM-dependent methyltransferase n=1 Tax=Cohnella sp. TaxID=1883426 RepID=UPI003561744C
MIVTTTERPPAEIALRALHLATELQAPYVPRSNKTIKSLYSEHGADEIVVVSRREVRLLSVNQQPFFFHPSMAIVRLKRLITGGTDTLLTVSDVKAGETVIDCTAGLCSDALVFSFAVGPRGRVIAIEASQVLHVVVREGLQIYETGLPEVDAALRTIETVHGHHEELLREMKDNSADIVYFDPMFEKPISTSSNLLPLRSQAHNEPLTEESVKHAIRIARKKVILKDHRDSGQFQRLGFSRVRVSTSAVAYGVITIDE